MEAYTDFAALYDLFMEETPYETWCDNICGILGQYDIHDGLMAELGCGTGKMTRLMAERGFDMIGIDNSVEMLEEAHRHENPKYDDHQGKAGNRKDAQCQEGSQKKEILYLLQDMREFELYGTVKAVISVCDSMNYLLEEEELKEVFSLADNYLDPGGIFVFDMNTLYKYREIMGEEVFAENLLEASFIWENDFDEETQINQYDVTFFCQEEQGLYRKFEETHFQRGYEIERIKELLIDAGLHFEAVLDAETLEPPTETTQRVYFVAREQKKKAAMEKG